MTTTTDTSFARVFARATAIDKMSVGAQFEVLKSFVKNEAMDRMEDGDDPYALRRFAAYLRTHGAYAIRIPRPDPFECFENVENFIHDAMTRTATKLGWSPTTQIQILLAFLETEQARDGNSSLMDRFVEDLGGGLELKDSLGDEADDEEEEDEEEESSDFDDDDFDDDDDDVWDDDDPDNDDD